MKLEITEEQKETIELLLENEIKGDSCFIEDLKEKEEKKYWEQEIIFLTKLKEVFKK